MNHEQLLMFGRNTKNIIIILMGMIFGAYIIEQNSLAKLDWIIIIIGLFCIIWDFYDWFSVFVINKQKLKTEGKK